MPPHRQLLAHAAALFLLHSTHAAPPVLVGTAKTDVTPTTPVVLAGYAARSTDYEGIDSNLFARALVIGDQNPVALVVIDNCGVPAAITRRLATRLAPHGIAPDHLVVAATHTHNAPNLTGYAPVLWARRTTAEQDERTAAYTEFAIDQMHTAVLNALANRQPMHLEWTRGTATFGANRRVLDNAGKWLGFGVQPDAPVDHSLPVLAARDASGTVRAVWANYACHCTTVGTRNHVGGDWAAANQAIESHFPATALTTIGCGADINPHPRGGTTDAERHGQSIAAEVHRLLAAKTTPLPHPPDATATTIDLPLEKPRPRPHWESVARGSNSFEARRADTMLHLLDTTGAIPSKVAYPLSTWTFGDDLAVVFLAGEVVVDYAVRLNRELDWTRLWTTAWTNAMPGYIPSARILAEGGYEADSSQVYYAQPGRYQPEVENTLVDAVHRLLDGRFNPPPDQKPPTFHMLPSTDPKNPTSTTPASRP